MSPGVGVPTPGAQDDGGDSRAVEVGSESRKQVVVVVGAVVVVLLAAAVSIAVYPLEVEAVLFVCLGDELRDLREVVVALEREAADAVEVAAAVVGSGFVFFCCCFSCFSISFPPSPSLDRGSEEVQEDRGVLAAVEGKGNVGGAGSLVWFCEGRKRSRSEKGEKKKKKSKGDDLIDSLPLSSSSPYP